MLATKGSLRSLIFAVTQIGRYRGVEKKVEQLLNMGVSPNHGYLFGGPYNQDCSIMGSILGFFYLGKLPCHWIAFKALNPKP